MDLAVCRAVRARRVDPVCPAEHPDVPEPLVQVGPEGLVGQADPVALAGRVVLVDPAGKAVLRPSSLPARHPSGWPHPRADVPLA
ncbi:hypothetical protein ACFWY9_39530 [Amycolatopsis sp. NPDC059027]|uniref:hypothetical protein n=1 Tax=Amycolatopsis sp. NPDC059027 TaxID=3346709 RepID=UPI003672F7B9